jgi:Flp pilus assembly pilin Flp
MLLSILAHLDYAVLLALFALAASMLSSLVGIGRELKAVWMKL